MKINGVWFIIIVILALLIGTGLGYGLHIFIVNKQTEDQAQAQQILEKELLKENKQNTILENSLDSNTTEEQIKYDGSQNIIINGKSYKISYNSDFYKYDHDYPVVVNLYFNDKKVRSINMPFQHGNLNIGEEINKEYKIELKNISNEYILVIISNKSLEYDYQDAELCVINLNGEYIGSKHWTQGPESVNLISNNMNLVRYEIYDDGFLVFYNHNGTIYTDERYVIKNNSIVLQNNIIYSKDKIETAGK